MLRKVFLLAAALLTASSFMVACGKKEEPGGLEKARESELQNFSEGRTPAPVHVPLPPENKIEVPADVKAKYRSVTMGVGNRKTQEIKKFTVRIGGEAKAPGTNYTVKVTAYLPNWSLQGKTVTSKGDKPNDPAVRAVIYDNKTKVFDGFIFQKNKTPSFVTDDYVIGLMGAEGR